MSGKQIIRPSCQKHPQGNSGAGAGRVVMGGLADWLPSVIKH
jgi:hypothetical protein